jgi:hypothetical protein
MFLILGAARDPDRRTNKSKRVRLIWQFFSAAKSTEHQTNSLAFIG